MKKNFKYALLSAIALVGAVSFSACSSSEEVVDNPDYNPETNSVKTTISLSINPNNGAATRQASDIVQASGNFRGIGNILCIPYTGDIATTTSTTGKMSWTDIDAFDGGSSNYKLYSNQEVAVGVDHFLFIGKVPYTSGTAAANLANGYTSNNLSDASAVGDIAITPVSIVASDDVSTSNSSTKNWKYQSDALAAYLTTIAKATGWSTSTNANLLGMYQQFTRTTPNAGSAKSISLLLGDLYTKLQGLTLNETEAAIRSAIVSAITAKATVSGSSAPYTFAWKDGKANIYQMFRIINKKPFIDYNHKQMKPRIYPKTQERLALMGEQIKLARLRRGLSASLIAERAGVSRTTVYMIAKGNPRISLGAIAAVLSSVGGMDEDLLAIGRDDIAGRTYQDLRLKIKKKGSR